MSTKYIRRGLQLLKNCNGFSSMATRTLKAPISYPCEISLVSRLLHPRALFIPSSYLHCSCVGNVENSSEFQNSGERSFDHEQETWDDIRRHHGGKLPSGVLELDEVVEFLREEGAIDIVVIKIPKEMCYVDYFIVATATSSRHLGSVAEMTNKFYKQSRKRGQPFAIVEGKRLTEDWQCVDLGNMVIHIMLEETRKHYNLEKLWVLGPKYDDLLHESPSDSEIQQRLAMEGLNLMSMNEDMVKALGNLDLSNPWSNEPEDSFNQNEDWFEDSTLSSDDKSKRNEDELGDDDAFLV